MKDHASQMLLLAITEGNSVSLNTRFWPGEIVGGLDAALAHAAGAETRAATNP